MANEANEVNTQLAAIRSELFAMEADARALAGTLSAALLSRLAIPADRDEAADYAVALFWRVVRGLVSQDAEQARPEHPDFIVQQKQQP